MANVPHFKFRNFHDGVQTMDLSSWKWFPDYIQKRLINYKTYAFRGQRDASWPLESTLDRAVKKSGKTPSTFDQSVYLGLFKASTRGRRGANPQELKPDDWWALGQHHGLVTPLLDWTESPFVALFFAFAKPREKGGVKRAVWAISRVSVGKKSKEMKGQPVVDFIFPQTDENARLVNQRGLFTKGPPGVSLEQWTEQAFRGEAKKCMLIKVVIPEKDGDRAECLKFLNRMNINYLTLFPDLYGSARFCATTLEIPNY